MATRNGIMAWVPGIDALGVDPFTIAMRVKITSHWGDSTDKTILWAGDLEVNVTDDTTTYNVDVITLSDSAIDIDVPAGAVFGRWATFVFTRAVGDPNDTWAIWYGPSHRKTAEFATEDMSSFDTIAIGGDPADTATAEYGWCGVWRTVLTNSEIRQLLVPSHTRLSYMSINHNKLVFATDLLSLPVAFRSEGGYVRNPTAQTLATYANAEQAVRCRTERRV